MPPKIPHDPRPFHISTTLARDHLSELITHVQDPRAYAILTRHGKPVAALVSMSGLRRIWGQEDVEAVMNGKTRVPYTTGPDGKPLLLREEGERIQKIQMDRKMERDLLQRVGLEVVPGGELMTEVEVARPKGWRAWLGGLAPTLRRRV